VRVEEGSLAQAEGLFDLVLVNILASVISEMAEQGLAERVTPGGMLVAAGLVADQEAEVAEALCRSGLTSFGRRQMEDWVTLEVLRPDAA
jgi:ribosomal protein L11 methyltransferase